MRLSVLIRPRSPPLLVACGRGRGRAQGQGQLQGQGPLQLARQFHDSNDNDDDDNDDHAARPSSASAFVWHNNATSDDYYRISEDLSYFPRFLSDTQQRTLLNAALVRLDHIGSYASRRKRLRLLRSTDADTDTDVDADADTDTDSLRHHNFLPDEYYDFEQAHFDRVILKFREARITPEQWSDKENVLPILTQITSLLPPVPLQTHILHLATNGHILPHIDNLQASGSSILAVSLGAPRILRLEKLVPTPSQHLDLMPVCDLLLEPGSVYIQKDYVRYNIRHSILPEGTIGGVFIPPGQRLSIMMRDMPGMGTSSMH